MGGGNSKPRASANVTLANDPEAIRAIEAEVLQAVADHGFEEAAQFAIRLALEEAVFNAFRHGHKNLPHEPVNLVWKIGPKSVRIVVEDKGPGFVPDSVPDPTHEDRLELPHGRGLMLMKAYMSFVEYNERGNKVTMVYERPAE